jgi:hypothetical protein
MGWRYSSTILDLGTRWRWVVNFTPLPLYPWGNSTRYPLDRRLGEPQSVWTLRNRKSFASTGNRLFGHPSRSLVAIPTELSRLPDWTYTACILLLIRCTAIARMVKVYFCCGTTYSFGRVYTKGAQHATRHAAQHATRHILQSSSTVVSVMFLSCLFGLFKIDGS